jgi:hypothetical protein
MGRQIKLIGALFVGLVAGTSAVQAQTNLPWCLELRSTVVECVYPTLDACLATRLGEGGECIPNPSR